MTQPLPFPRLEDAFNRMFAATPKPVAPVVGREHPGIVGIGVARTETAACAGLGRRRHQKPIGPTRARAVWVAWQRCWNSGIRRRRILV